MATAESLTEEFECPVCGDVFMQPKFVGPCSHTLCRDCIQNYVTALMLGRRDAFPCPVCREDCIIPDDGVDGLRNNFHLSRIIERYKKERGNPSPDARCSVCQEKAKSHCKTCDSINLCSSCTKRHNSDPKTKGHDLLCLCSQHHKPLSLYCKGCKRAICTVCKLSEHNMEKHDVSPHRDVFVEAFQEISAAKSELQNAVTRVEEKQEDLTAFWKMVQNVSPNVVEYRVAAVFARVEECLPCLVSRKMAIKARLETDVPCSTILDSHSVENLITISKDLLDLASESNDPDIATLIEGIETQLSFRNTEPTNSDGSGRSRLKPLNSVFFPVLHLCREVLRMRRLPDGRLVILSRSSPLFHAGHIVDRAGFTTIRTVVKLYIYDPARSWPTTRATQFDVDSATDMAVTSVGELVVGYDGKKKYISKLNIEMGTITSNISIGEILGVHAVETDEADNVFCTTVEGLFVVQPNRNVNCIIRNENAGWKRMAYCKVTGVLYIVARGKIIGFLWNGRTLTQSPALSLDVDGIATDIAIGSGGGIVVTCKMERDLGFMYGPKIRVYEMIQDKGKKDAMKAMHFHRERRSHWRHEWEPVVCTNNDQLWLGCGSRVELCETISAGNYSSAENELSLEGVLKVIPFKDTSLGVEMIAGQSAFIITIALFCCFASLFLDLWPACTSIQIVVLWLILVGITLAIFFVDGPYDHRPISRATIRQLLKTSVMFLFVMVETAIIMVPCLLIWRVLAVVMTCLRLLCCILENHRQK